MREEGKKKGVLKLDPDRELRCKGKCKGNTVAETGSCVNQQTFVIHQPASAHHVFAQLMEIILIAIAKKTGFSKAIDELTRKYSKRSM